MSTSARKRQRSSAGIPLAYNDDMGEETAFMGGQDARESAGVENRGSAGGRQSRRPLAGGDDRRARHNAVERKRQQQLSTFIGELGEFLEENGIEVRRDKVSILTTLLKFLRSDDGWAPDKRKRTGDDRFPLARGVDFAGVFAHNATPMMIAEPHGRIVACNDAFCGTFQTTNDMVTRGPTAMNLLQASTSDEFHSTLRSIAMMTGHTGVRGPGGEQAQPPRFGESVDVRRTLVVPTQYGTFMEAPVTMRMYVAPAQARPSNSLDERTKRALGAGQPATGAKSELHLVCLLFGATDAMPAHYPEGPSTTGAPEAPQQPQGDGAGETDGAGMAAPGRTAPADGAAPAASGGGGAVPSAGALAAAAAPAPSGRLAAELYSRYSQMDPAAAAAAAFASSPTAAAYARARYYQQRPPAPAPYPYSTHMAGVPPSAHPAWAAPPPMHNQPAAAGPGSGSPMLRP